MRSRFPSIRLSGVPTIRATADWSPVRLVHSARVRRSCGPVSRMSTNRGLRRPQVSLTIASSVAPASSRCTVVRGAQTTCTMPSGRSHIRNFGWVMTPVPCSAGSSMVEITVPPFAMRGSLSEFHRSTAPARQGLRVFGVSRSRSRARSRVKGRLSSPPR